MRKFLASIMAGMFIALGGLGSQYASLYVGKLAGALIFPIGLSMVILTKSNLFTGKCLLISSVLEKKITAKDMIKDLFLFYVGNFIGALFIAVCTKLTSVANVIDLTSVAEAKTSAGFISLFIKGILCNILVCVAVYMAGKTEDAMGKMILCFLPVTLFVLCGFEHSIANMYFIPAGIMAGANTDVLGFFYNLIPVTLGNIIGGMGFGATMTIMNKE